MGIGLAHIPRLGPHGHPQRTCLGLEVVQDELEDRRRAGRTLLQQPGIAQNLEVPARGGLGQLDNARQFTNGQLFPLQEHQDAKTHAVSYYDIPAEPRGAGSFGSGMRRGITDSQDRLWWGGFDGGFIGLLDPRKPRGQEMKLYAVPFPYFFPYDAHHDERGYTWTAGIYADRVARFNVDSGEWSFYLLPFEANIRGTWNLLEACRVCPKLVERVIVASSDKAYGSHDQLPYTESAPLQGRFPYDVSKSCADLITFSYFATYRTPVAITRCGNLFGAGDLNFNRLIPGTIRSVFRSERPVVRSDGRFIRDYFYVLDAVDAYLQLAERLPAQGFVGEAFNFGTEQPLSVIEMVNTVLQLMNRTDLSPLILNQANHEIPQQYLDCSKARMLMGWQPKYTLEDALRATIDWYGDWLERSRVKQRLDTPQILVLHGTGDRPDACIILSERARRPCRQPARHENGHPFHEQ